MTGPDEADATDGTPARATVRTTHAAAATVAAAVAPDNTDATTTRVDGDAVVTTVGRPTAGGLWSTVDDYVVNLRVADRVVVAAADGGGDDTTDEHGHGIDATDGRADDADADADTTST